MKIRPIVFLFGFLILLFGDRPLQAATPLAKVIMTSGSASERDGVLYVAQDLGLFRKYGVDLSFVQVRNAMSALSSGETQFHWGSVSGANLGAIAEGADLVFIAGFIDRLSGMFANQNSGGAQGQEGCCQQLERRRLDFFHVDARLMGTGAGAGQDPVSNSRRTGGDGPRRYERFRGRGVPWPYLRHDASGQRISCFGRQRETAHSLSEFGSHLQA